ncbi:LacI family DNA-binding transcriptional regulator [Cognatishimia sp.]|uniref:LacI family DNA-binding transcriptional regulator n=1 Tax=Cognatishimia sp. TaxID=2211648 RepID=UPI00351389B2
MLRAEKVERKAVTVQDVARVAGVSTATVSRALSDPKKVSEKTRKAVTEAISATGYRLNKAARNLRKRQANAVLILVPNLGNPFFSQILHGISAGFSDTEFSILVSDTSDQAGNALNLVDYFLDSRIDGLISLDGSLPNAELDLFHQHGVADKIVFACEWSPEANFPSVRSNNAMGARLAVRHLFDLGHRKIAHVTGPEGNVLTRARREGMLEERQRLDLPMNPDWIVRGDFSLESGFDAAQKIARMKDRPTAVFCASDMVAFGLISGLKQQGLSVPEDISVVGFDDIEMAEYSDPPLTTINQDREGLGRASADRLLAQLRPDVGEDRQIIKLDVYLAERQSTRAI